MTFSVQYPVFVINKDDDVALVKVKHESAEAMTHALPVFTDTEAAKDFRDEHFSGWSLGAFPDEEALARLLTALREKVFLVAFDPYRMATRPATIPLNVLLEQMKGA
jgi:hypothetical protein